MEHEHLVEKHPREAGLPELRVNWVILSSGASVNDALLSGGVQFVAGGPAPFDTPSPMRRREAACDPLLGFTTCCSGTTS